MADTDSPVSAAYAEVIRELSIQASALDALRARSGTVIATASLVTTFLGGRVLLPKSAKAPVGHIDVLGWAAIACLVGIALLIIVVMRPYKWEWTQRANDLIVTYETPGSPVTNLVAAQREIALHLQRGRDANEILLGRLARCFDAATVLLVCETILWILDLQGA